MYSPVSDTATIEGVAPAVAASLDRSYTFRDRDDVTAFLAEHPSLPDLLVEASSRIARLFPLPQPLALEIFRNIEEDEAEGILFVVIPTKLTPEEALRLLDRLDDDWLVDAVRQTRGRFNVNLEYV